MSRFVSALRTTYRRTRATLASAPRLKAFTDSRTRSVVQTLSREGACLFPNYLSPERCAQLRAELDRLIAEYRDKLWVDPEAADHRVYGADRVSSAIREYARDPFINEVLHAYAGADQCVFFTLANRVHYKPGNLGSGGGWHRDTAIVKQFKAMVYLTDVDEQHGAFEYVPRSHELGFLVRSLMRVGLKHMQTRFKEDEVEQVKRRLGVQSVKAVGPQGTLLIFDSSILHRGSPIQVGHRDALTNYCFDPQTIRSFQQSGKFIKYFVDREEPAATV